MSNKQLPQQFEAEQSVLGALLLDSEREVLSDVFAILAPEDFCRPQHRLIYETIQSLWADGAAIDELTVIARLEAQGQLKQAGGATHISVLSAATPTAVNAAHWAQLVRDAAVARRLIAITSEATEAAYQRRDIRELVNDVARQLSELTQQHSQRETVSAKVLMRELFEELEARSKDPNALPGVPTGFRDLDAILGGWQPSDLVVIAGRPSMGKTALAVESARHASTLGYPSLICSLEMSRGQLGLRMLSVETKIDSNQLRMGRLRSTEWGRLAFAMEQISALRLSVNDAAAQTLEHVTAQARKKRHNGGLGLVVVDYLQLMRGPKSAGNREQEIAALSRGLKGLAKELEVPVLAISQLNRSVEQREDKRPRLGDLRESGAIEQDADVVVFVYRDEYYNPGSPDIGTAEVIVAKQRNGPLGVARLKFFACYAKFTDLEKHRNG